MTHLPIGGIITQEKHTAVGRRTAKVLLLRREQSMSHAIAPLSAEGADPATKNAEQPSLHSDWLWKVAASMENAYGDGYCSYLRQWLWESNCTLNSPTTFTCWQQQYHDFIRQTQVQTVLRVSFVTIAAHHSPHLQGRSVQAQDPQRH